MKSLCRSTNRTATFRGDFAANDDAVCSISYRMTQKFHDSESLAREGIARCQAVARFSQDVGSIRRTFLSPPMRDCHREIAAWLAPLRAESSIDAVRNLHIFYPPTNTNPPALVIGSPH